MLGQFPPRLAPCAQAIIPRTQLSKTAVRPPHRPSPSEARGMLLRSPAAATVRTLMPSLQLDAPEVTVPRFSLRVFILAECPFAISCILGGLTVLFCTVIWGGPLRRNSPALHGSYCGLLVNRSWPRRLSAGRGCQSQDPPISTHQNLRRLQTSNVYEVT